MYVRICMQIFINYIHTHPCIHTCTFEHTQLSPVIFLCYFFLKILFIYSTEIETASERGNRSRGSRRGRRRLIAEEPDVGLDPITLGSHPEPKADA